MDENMNEEEIVEKEESESPSEECGAEAEDLSARIEELEERLEASAAECEKNLARAKDLNTMYVRLQADFDNYKKRTSEQMKKERGEGIADVMEKIIPLADVIDKAMSMIADENVKQGVAMVARELENTMSAFGVSEIKALGKPFDPSFHEAILRVPSDKEESGTVIEVFRKGYIMGDKVLRHCVVKVAE